MGGQPFVARLVAGPLVEAQGRAARRSPGGEVQVDAARAAREVARRVVAGDVAALARFERQRALHPSLAPPAQRDLQDAARRIGVGVGARDGDHLDLLDLRGAQRAQVGEQPFGLHAQFALAHEDLRSRLAVDRDLVVGDPDARSRFEQLHAVLADGRGGVGHVHDVAVGLAPDELRLDDHPFDRRGGALQHDVAQVGRAGGDAHRTLLRLVAERLDRERVRPLGSLQREAAVAAGGRAGRLFAVAQQHDGGEFHAVAAFVRRAARQGGGAGGKAAVQPEDQGADEKQEQLIEFHGVRFLRYCGMSFIFRCKDMENNLYYAIHTTEKFRIFLPSPVGRGRPGAPPLIY